jgi:hypothetical protein
MIDRKPEIPKVPVVGYPEGIPGDIGLTLN